MNCYVSDRERLVRIFEDTLRFCRNEEKLKQAIQESISGTVLYVESDNPKLTPRSMLTRRFRSTSIGRWRQRSIIGKNIPMRR